MTWRTAMTRSRHAQSTCKPAPSQYSEHAGLVWSRWVSKTASSKLVPVEVGSSMCSGVTDTTAPLRTGVLLSSALVFVDELALAEQWAVAIGCFGSDSGSGEPEVTAWRKTLALSGGLSASG